MDITEITEAIKQNTKLEDYVSKNYVALDRRGSNFEGYCPFHDNTDSPSFIVFPDAQNWYCFGECKEGGDLIDFVQKIEGMSFIQAVELIAKKIGMDITTHMSEKEFKKYKYKKKLYAVMDDAQEFFEHFLHHEQGRQAFQYLSSYRNLSGETLSKFGLGFAPDDWSRLVTYLTRKGHSEEDIITVGLAKRNGGNKLYAVLKNKVTFPIRNTSGKIVAFGARVLDHSTPKYINTSNSPIFTKGMILYGINEARTEMRETNTAVAVEGYMDAIMAHQHGFKNVVSVMGASLTPEQVKSVSPLADRIILAFDPDKAGDKGAISSALKVERSTDLDIYVASLPDDRDPDELVDEDAGAFSLVLWNASPLIMHLATARIEKHRSELSDPKIKKKIVNELMPLIESVPDPTEQAGYKEWLAKELGFEKYKLTISLPNGRRVEV